MMDTIRQWLIGIVAAGILAAVSHTLTPQGTVKRVARMAGGLLVMLAVIQPLLKLDTSAAISFSTEQYERELDISAKKMDEAEESVMKKLIEEQTAAYILREAGIMGLSLKVTVQARAEDDEEYPKPYAVQLSGGSAANARTVQALTEWIAQTLEIPTERVRWSAEG